MAMVLYHKNKEITWFYSRKIKFLKTIFLWGEGVWTSVWVKQRNHCSAKARLIPIKFYYNKLLTLFACMRKHSEADFRTPSKTYVNEDCNSSGYHWCVEFLLKTCSLYLNLKIDILSGNILRVYQPMCFTIYLIEKMKFQQ